MTNEYLLKSSAMSSLFRVGNGDSVAGGDEVVGIVGSGYRAEYFGRIAAVEGSARSTFGKHLTHQP